MVLPNKIKEKIATEVIKTLVSRFDSFPEDASQNRNAPFHEAFLNAFKDKFDNKVSDIPFFISLSSWLQGLNTTLGQTFFENIAHHISQGEKREYTSRRLGNLKITQTQRNHISKIIADLSTSTKQPSLINENQLLFSEYNDDLIDAMDFSADVFIEDDDSVCAIELKSVKPNSGEMKGEKQKIMEGKAALYLKFPNKEIKFYIGFPFDPTLDTENEPITSFNKDRFLGQIINMTKYFDKNETLVASELWDFLSGETQTMEQILEVINSISTVNFLDKYQYLIRNENRTNQEYKDILLEWNLYSELELIENDAVLKQKINGDRKLTRIYNKQAFESNNSKKGSYRYDRYTELIALL
ncbi:MAG TPA: TdeIII family type II restriction endonuclease [Ignavibacteria bacterium]|nr:TdeIII family type II restriction endonuclease [Ignavibacteria bacterium]